MKKEKLNKNKVRIYGWTRQNISEFCWTYRTNLFYTILCFHFLGMRIWWVYVAAAIILGLLSLQSKNLSSWKSTNWDYHWKCTDLFPCEGEVPDWWCVGLVLSILERFKGAAYLQLADCYSSIKHPQIILSIILSGQKCKTGSFLKKLSTIKQVLWCKQVLGSH